ncbi:MAG: ABC transporter ATP-binding protein, partial [Propionibacteriaceae bacterium]
MAAIELEDVSREFRSGGQRLDALANVSFEVPQGQIIALLGENGAGKTTLTKILATLLWPSSGRARVMGLDVVNDAADVRRKTSLVLGGDRGLYPMLTGLDNLLYFGVLRGLSHRHLRRHGHAALETVGLGKAAKRKVGEYSKGMRQRLHLAIGFLTEAPVLLLDEPSVGLDPTEAENLR